MGVCSDIEIKALSVGDGGVSFYGYNTMIYPFVDHQVKEEDGKKVISYGLSSYGYDIRLSNEFHFPNSPTPLRMDPKNMDPNVFQKVFTSEYVIPPNGFVLGISKEYFCIPRDIITICVGKSTYARCGIILNVTPFEPEWEGYAVLEISNTTNLPAVVYANEGIAQVIFLKGNTECLTSYADKKGKYQCQEGMTYAK